MRQNFELQIAKHVMVNIAFFLLGSALISLIYSIVNETSFLYAWEWYHDSFLYFIFMVLSPLTALYLLLVILNESGKLKLPDLFKYSKLSVYVKNYILTIIGLTFFFFGGQILGGCIWQIPNILTDHPSYTWLRFGHGKLPEYILIILYTLGFSISNYFFFTYTNLEKREKEEALKL